MQEKLEYEVLIYILAILGLPLCCCVGFGAIPAGIAFFIANNELKKCYEREEPYVNQNSIYTGKIISLIILIINVLYVARIIYVLYTVGTDEFMQIYQETLDKYQ